MCQRMKPVFFHMIHTGRSLTEDHTNRVNPDVRKVIEITERVENILNEIF